MADFDFIVVGTGSAGSVVAARLSEDPATRVLVLEAGGADVPEGADDPRFWPGALGSEVDWDYPTVPQRGLGGRVVREPHGRMLGGSSSLNGMLYVRGHPVGFDAWAYGGATGWGHASVLPYFRRAEDFVDDDGEGLGHGGPLHIVNAGARSPHPASRDFLAACSALGHAGDAHWNTTAEEAMIGAGWFRLNVKEGRRFGTGHAYLRPALARPNIEARFGARATRLLFDGAAAAACVGVAYVQGGEEHEALASREVLLCAGAAESPKLLMLSGIGPAGHLGEHGVAPRVDLPGVGANFHDHVYVPVVYDLARPAPEPTQAAFEAGLFFRSDPGWPVPDCQLIFGASAFGDFGRGPPEAFTIVTALTRPMARGTVRLASADPLDAPLLDPDLLGEEGDVRRLVHAVAVARSVFGADPLRGWVSGPRSPGPALDPVEAARANALSQWHMVGSCKMGQDRWAVVDPELRVRGAERLRVVDSSVFPTVPSGNSQAACVMVAERASDLVRRANGIPVPAAA